MFPSGGGIFGMMNQMNQMMNSMLNDPFLTGMPPPMMQQRQQYPQQDSMPRVEEVPQHTQQHAPSGGQGPIVEEPDDDDAEAAEETQPQQYQAQQQRAAPPANAPHDMMLGAPMINPFGGLFGSMFGNMGMPGFDMNMQGGGGNVYTYSSSSVYSSGPDGTYHSSTTSRQAPGGVRETQKTVRDGRTRQESMTIQRGIGDRERIVHRSRDATGQIQAHERNIGLDPDSAAHFDTEWVQHAEQAMPTWMDPNRARAQQLQGSNRQQQQPQLALPSTGQQYQRPAQQQQQQQYHAGGQYGVDSGRHSSGSGGGYSAGGWSGGYHV